MRRWFRCPDWESHSWLLARTLGLPPLILEKPCHEFLNDHSQGRGREGTSDGWYKILAFWSQWNMIIWITDKMSWLFLQFVHYLDHEMSKSYYYCFSELFKKLFWWSTAQTTKLLAIHFLTSIATSLTTHLSTESKHWMRHGGVFSFSSCTLSQPLFFICEENSTWVLPERCHCLRWMGQSYKSDSCLRLTDRSPPPTVPGKHNYLFLSRRTQALSAAPRA